MSERDADATSSSISEFYNEQRIFVTGATGFVGKVLLEKLLRCSPNLKTLYVLVRAQKGKTAKQRIAEILSGTVFDHLRQEQPTFVDKVVVCEGDIMKSNFGLNESDTATLIDNVSVVFHSAATIKFDETLKISVKMNVVGVKQLIALCHKMKNLKALVHVSTAFSHCDRPQIDEAIYPPALSPDKLIETMNWMSDDLVQMLTPKLIGKQPNTYTFSKCLAEYVLVQEGKGLPMAIVRPSIIGACWKEPTPGWIDNMNGPSGLMLAVGKGFMRVMRIDMDTIAEIIPVDIAVNMMIAVGWYTSTAHPSQCLVYNCTTGGHNPCRWKEMVPICMKAFYQYPFDDILRRPRLDALTNTYAWFYWRFVSHMLPAYIIDFFSRLIGKRPRMVQAMSKLDKAIVSLDFFTQKAWDWSNRNGDCLWSKLSPKDQELYDFDVSCIEWNSYYKNFALGIKQFILREDMGNVALARRQLTKFQSMRFMFNTIMFLFFSRCLIKYSSMARSMWFSLLQLCLNMLSRLRLLTIL